MVHTVCPMSTHHPIQIQTSRFVLYCAVLHYLVSKVFSSFGRDRLFIQFSIALAKLIREFSNRRSVKKVCNPKWGWFHNLRQVLNWLNHYLSTVVSISRLKAVSVLLSSNWSPKCEALFTEVSITQRLHFPVFDFAILPARGHFVIFTFPIYPLTNTPEYAKSLPYQVAYDDS